MGFKSNQKVVDYLRNSNTTIAPVSHLAWEVIIVACRIESWVRPLITFPNSLHNTWHCEGSPVRRKLSAQLQSDFSMSYDQSIRLSSATGFYSKIWWATNSNGNSPYLGGQLLEPYRPTTCMEELHT